MQIPQKMRAVVYQGVNHLRVETVPVPDIGPGELLVKVAACGVCPTDIKKIQYGTVPPPRIFGHETAGTIVRVGDEVTSPSVRKKKARGLGHSLASHRSSLAFKPGDRVALHHHVPCLKCHACRHRAFAQCLQYKKTGITAGFEPAGGGYAEYVRVMPFVLPGVVKIPSNNSFLEGAMLEPVNTVLKAVNRLRLLKGDSVLVAGQGPIGLMFTRLLALRGMRVVATDLIPQRLELARAFGAAAALQPGILNRGDAKSAEKRGGRKAGGRGREEAVHQPSTINLQPSSSGLYDAAVIAVSSNAVVEEAVRQVRGGGQVLLFSHTKRGDEMPVDLATICVDEKDLIGSYSADFLLQDEVADLVFSRKLDVRKLITHEFPLEKTAEAIALASKPTAESLKIVVRVRP